MTMRKPIFVKRIQWPLELLRTELYTYPVLSGTPLVFVGYGCCAPHPAW